ncbi:MAG: hypothetical protein Q9186_007303 [Xanthomendoza sp. 1 TL-2023]
MVFAGTTMVRGLDGPEEVVPISNGHLQLVQASAFQVIYMEGPDPGKVFILTGETPEYEAPTTPSDLSLLILTTEDTVAETGPAIVTTRETIWTTLPAAISQGLTQASDSTLAPPQSTQTSPSLSTSEESTTVSLNSTTAPQKPKTTSNEPTRVSPSRTTSQASKSAAATSTGSSANNLSHKIGAGVGIPVGCVLVVIGLLYLRHHRKMRRHSHEQRRRQVENLRNDYVSEALRIFREPQELDTRVRTRPYVKPELSDEARRNIVELSPEYLRELAGNRILRVSSPLRGQGQGQGGEGLMDQGWI